MIKEVIVYPDNRILACGDVRGFDESVGRLFNDMKETMEHYGLDALSAIQVSHPFNMFIVKKEGEYIEFANPSILSKEKLFEAEEQSSYYPNITAIVPRYEKMKIIYEDRNGKTCYMNVDSDRHFATMFQQMMDFSLGGTMLDRIDTDQRQHILDTIENKESTPKTNEVCPTFSKKDYFVSFADKLLFFMGLSLLTPIFNLNQSTIENIYIFDKITFPAIILLMIGFFFYAQYEAKQYKQCSSCQIGNNIGVIIKRGVIALVFAVGAYFLVNPN
ncbi:MAG: peptide deformylase [Sulfurovum sp.]|nr:peptide deformylase [Sulfurovum sp.]